MSWKKVVPFFVTALVTFGYFAHGQMEPLKVKPGSEVRLFTPWNFVRASMEKYFDGRSLNDRRDFQNLDWQLGQWTPHLSSVQSDLTAKTSITSFSDHDLEMATKHLAFKLDVKKFVINQIIERQMGGAVLKVKVQAECGPLIMSQDSASMNLHLDYQVLPQGIQTKVTVAELKWAPHSWKLSDLNCQGPIGFDKTVHDELVNELSSPEKVRPWLQDLLTQKLQAEANTLLTELAKPFPVSIPNSGLPLTLVFRNLESSPEGLSATGVLVWNGNAQETDVYPLPDTHLPKAALNSKTPILLTPAAGWSGLIEAERRAKGSTYSFSMLKISAFRDLLNSPNEMAVVWPDLNYYTVNTPFNMILNSPTNYNLRWMNDATATLQSPVSGAVRAQRVEEMWTYLHISGAVTGRLIVGISKGVVTTTVKVSHSDFSAKFDPKYVARFHPNEYIDARVFSAFENYVNQGFTNSYALPTMKLGEFGSAQFNGWQAAGPQEIALPVLVHQN